MKGIKRPRVLPKCESGEYSIELVFALVGFVGFLIVTSIMGGCLNSSGPARRNQEFKQKRYEYNHPEADLEQDRTPTGYRLSY